MLIRLMVYPDQDHDGFPDLKGECLTLSRLIPRCDLPYKEVHKLIADDIATVLTREIERKRG
jgi:hypothetical protein